MKNLDWAKVANYLSFSVIGLGFLALYLGWNGAANKACVDCQIPYLISGGAVGLGLIATGLGVLVVQNGRRNSVQLERHIQTLTEALGGDASQVTKAPPRLQRGEVLAGATTFHTADCQIAQGRDVQAMSRRAATHQGLEPCRVCNP